MERSCETPMCSHDWTSLRLQQPEQKEVGVVPVRTMRRPELHLHVDGGGVGALVQHSKSGLLEEQPRHTHPLLLPCGPALQSCVHSRGVTARECCLCRPACLNRQLVVFFLAELYLESSVSGWNSTRGHDRAFAIQKFALAPDSLGRTLHMPLGSRQGGAVSVVGVQGIMAAGEQRVEITQGHGVSPGGRGSPPALAVNQVLQLHHRRQAIQPGIQPLQCRILCHGTGPLVDSWQ